MKRVLAGFLLAPLTLLAFWDGFPFSLLLVAYALCALVALPLFFLFRRLAWFRWWQVTLSGALSALVFVAFYLSINPYHSEIYGPLNSVLFFGYGLSVAFVFWWLAIYKNGALPQAPNSFPRSVVLVIPLACAGWLYHGYLKPETAKGTVAESAAGGAEMVEVPVRLESGEAVTARALGDHSAAYTKGRGVLMESRNSALFLGKRFWIIACTDQPLCT